MDEPRNRRRFLVLTSSAILGACVKSRGTASPATAPGPGALASLEQRLGGRLGVFALESEAERWVAYRQDERFAMCSTFKWVLAAAVLSRVDRGDLLLSQSIPYGARDILANSPVTSAALGNGKM